MHRRNRRRKGLFFRVALMATIGSTLFALGLAVFSAVLTHSLASKRQAAHHAEIIPAVSYGERPIYPYSVIPGGVRDSEELTSSLSRDTVAARHYAGFSPSRAVLMFLREDRSAYVSYRLNNRIYWTSRKVKLSHGEFLLTDGANLVRARCGNRVSETPQAPTSASEPEEIAMDWTPPAAPLEVPAYIAELPMPPPLPNNDRPIALLSLPNPPPASFETYYEAPVVLEAPRVSNILVVNRPWLGTPTPEPATFLPIACGLAFLLYKRVRTARQRSAYLGSASACPASLSTVARSPIKSANCSIVQQR